jgi:tetratricopeptide (TPR) repeat protein
MDSFGRQAMEEKLDLLVAKGSCVAGAAHPYSPFRDVMAMLTGDVEARWSAGAISGDHARRLWSALPLVCQELLKHGPHLLQILLTGETLVNRAMAAEPAGASWLHQLRKRVQAFQGEIDNLEQSHLFEQFTNVLRALAQRRPLLLLLDDIQWIDAASIGLLFYLGRRLTNGGGRILIVCAYRPEEIIRDLRGGQHLLAKVLGEFRRTFGDVWLSLSWAGEEEGRRFVNALLDGEPNQLGERFRDALFEFAGGHPLFTVELLRTMQDRGDLIKDADGRWREGPALDWGRLPARVEAVIEERIDRLEVSQRQILAVASVEGERFTAEVVARVQGIDQRELLGQLSQELEKHHRLVREGAEVKTSRQALSRYQFSHILFQRHLYDNLSSGERRLLHREIAQALEAMYEGETAEIATQLAHHYREAGEGERAIAYNYQAAQRAKAVYAYDEAIQHLQSALDLLESSDDVETRMELLEELADVHKVLVTDTQAISTYQAALDLWSSLASADKMIAVRLHRKILEFAFQMRWNVPAEKFDALSQTLAISRAFLEAGLPLEGDERSQMEMVRVLSALANDSDSGMRPLAALDAAEEYAQAAVDLAEQLGAPVEMSDALGTLTSIYFVRGLLPEQLEASRRRLALSQDPRFNDLRKRSHILESLSDALIAVGEYDQALTWLMELGNLTLQMGAIAEHVWSMGLQALCLFRLDRWEEIIELEENRRELEGRHSADQLGGGICVVISLSAATRALQGDQEEARFQRDQAYELMQGAAGGNWDNWFRTQYY